MTHAISHQTLEEDIKIEIEEVTLAGNVMVPKGASSVVLFAHGSGSSRNSPRNRYVARVLHEAGLGTLLFDLLTLEEEAVDVDTAEFRFDIELLATRLVSVTDWVLSESRLAHLAIGYFGSSTGGGAALAAAAERPAVVRAVVSRGGRPDLAGAALGRVRAPTLLIVGGMDDVVIELNRSAMEKMQCEVKLEIVSRATHLFEEPGTLEQVAEMASNWFREKC